MKLSTKLILSLLITGVIVENSLCKSKAPKIDLIDSPDDEKELESELEGRLEDVNSMIKALEDLMNNEDTKNILNKENDENASDEEREVAKNLREEYESAKKAIEEMTKGLEDLESDQETVMEKMKEQARENAPNDQVEADNEYVDDL